MPLEIEIKGNGTAVINDHVLGRREIGLGDWLALIKDQHQVLCAFRDDGRVPTRELIDDIRAYESILMSEDPGARANQYFEERRLEASVEGMMRVRPRHIAKRLGWME